jgi:MoaA/NifB/PqqE/SkfB family radical SAM enzyme
MIRNAMLESIGENLMDKFKMVFIEFVATCNYKCLFCRTSYMYMPSTIRLSEFKDFESLIDMADQVNISGYGELALSPDFNEIINILTKHNKKIELVTNASLLTDEKIKVLENSSLDILNISLNSLNPETYKKLTTYGNLEHILSNVNKILNSKIRNIRYLQCSFVINALNFKEIKNIIDFGAENNINIRLHDLVTSIKDYDPTLLFEDNEENRKYFEECNKYGFEKLGDKYHPFQFETRRRDGEFKTIENEQFLSDIIKGCDWIDRIFNIDFYGDVYSCCWSRCKLGNIKQNTLEEIMNGEVYKDLKKNIKIGSSKYCSDCRRLG